TLTNLVATRSRPLGSGVFTGPAVISLQLAILRSSGSYSPWLPYSMSTSLPATPRSAAPCSTSLGTSVARTISRRTSGSVVPKISLRLLFRSSTGSMPASFSSGRVSSRMRPLDRAMVRLLLMCLLSGGNAADAGTQHLQLFLDAFVTAINVVDAVDQGIAIGPEAGDHQAGGGPQVGRHDRSTLEPVNPGNDGGVALDLDLGTHAAHFLHVHEAVLEHRLDHGAGALGQRIHGHELGLHVGGECRIGRGTQVDRLRAIALHVQTDPVLAGVDVGAGFFQLEQYRFEGAGIGVLHAHPAAGDRASHQEGAGFNPVGHHRVTGAVQALDALDGDGIGAVALDLRAHGDQALGQIHHFGLTG